MDLASGFTRMKPVPAPAAPAPVPPSQPRTLPGPAATAAAITIPAPSESYDTALEASPATGGRLLLPEEMDMGEVMEEGRGNVFKEVELRREQSASYLRAAGVSKGEQEGGGDGTKPQSQQLPPPSSLSQEGDEEHYSVLVYSKPSGQQVAIMVEIGLYFGATAALLGLVAVAVKQ